MDPGGKVFVVLGFTTLGVIAGALVVLGVMGWLLFKHAWRR